MASKKLLEEVSDSLNRSLVRKILRFHVKGKEKITEEDITSAIMHDKWGPQKKNNGHARLQYHFCHHMMNGYDRSNFVVRNIDVEVPVSVPNIPGWRTDVGMLVMWNEDIPFYLMSEVCTRNRIDEWEKKSRFLDNLYCLKAIVVPSGLEDRAKDECEGLFDMIYVKEGSKNFSRYNLMSEERIENIYLEWINQTRPDLLCPNPLEIGCDLPLEFQLPIP